MTRRRISSGSPFEAKWGYSRAVVDGGWVFVSGTTGFDYATMTISSDPATQARVALDNAAKALSEAGASLADVVRARYIVTDAANWDAIGAVVGEVFADARPAATAIVCGLVDPRMLFEVELTARKR